MTKRIGDLCLLFSAMLGILLSGCTPAPAANHSAYSLGKRADPAGIARQDIDVAPDGTGLPDGHGDAVDGAVLFAQSCQRCHGTAIRLDPKRWPYATTLFDYIRRAMPPDRPRQLAADDVYALTAYELNVNGLLTPHELLDKTTLSNHKIGESSTFVGQP